MHTGIVRRALAQRSSRLAYNVEWVLSSRALAGSPLSGKKHIFYWPSNGSGLEYRSDALSSSVAAACFNSILVHHRGYAKAKKASVDENAKELDVSEEVAHAKQLATSHGESAIEGLSVELSKLRTGRASAGMLDHITVDIQGIKSPLNRVAAISVLNPQMLNVMPFDPSSVKQVEAAIRASPLGLGSDCAEQVIKVTVPKLTKEHCESMSKLIGKAGEAAKMSIRRGRQTAMDNIKKLAKAISKDELKRYEKDVEDITKKFIKSVEDLCKTKEKEIIGGL